jgi:heat-inducible transcriptional repressor
MEAADRSRRVLAALIREYIATGEPVSSSVLASAGLGVSSATVRNILARLEDDGYVQQPHTSAGRVPTVSHVLSQASRSFGFAMRPAHETAVFDRVEFVPLSSTRVLVIIIARGGHVLQKAIDTDESFSADDLRQAATYLNVEFSGLPLSRAREAVLERIREERLLYDALMARAMRLATFTFAGLTDDHSIYFEGAAALIEEAHGLTVGALQALVQMIEEKQRLVSLLNEYIDGPGLTIVIGAEHQDPNLRPFSLIAATFDDGTTTATVGVIGPTRMRYPRAIAVVDGAAQAISRVLRNPN